jgi:hypothetical protein
VHGKEEGEGGWKTEKVGEGRMDLMDLLDFLREWGRAVEDSHFIVWNEQVGQSSVVNT